MESLPLSYEQKVINVINPKPKSNDERPYLKLANLVKEKRLEKELSQREFSKILGMSNSYVAHLEGGKIQPFVGTLRSISATLGIPYNKLAILAKYIDEAAFDQITQTNTTRRDNAFSDLTEKEWISVMDYVDYIRSKREN